MSYKNKSLEELQHKVREREKELNCLYKISDYSYEKISIDEFIEKVVDIIPPSFQYPDTTEVKITIREKEYVTKNYKPSEWKLTHDIIIDEKKSGEIEINYQDEMPEHDEGPFLTEEKNLINGIAEIVGRTINSKLREIALKEKNEEYLAINEELKEKNEEFLALNEELKERNEEYQALNEELNERNEAYQAVNEELKEEIERRSEAQKLLQEQHDGYLAIFDNHPDVLYVVDIETYEVLFVNDAFKKILGDDPIGKKCYEEFYGLDKPCNFCKNQEIKKNPKEPYIWEHHNSKLNKDFLITDQLIKWPDGRDVKFELSVDITERKKAQIIIENTMKELQRSNKELEQFAYVASHDLQEPLRKVKNFAELFARKYSGALDEKAEQYINYMTSGVNRMQNLILDLLSFSRVTTRGKKFEIMELEKVIKTIEENLQMVIEESNAKIIYDDLPIIKADESQIGQLLQNLISNAIKFRSDDDPVIKIRAKSKKDYWEVSVQDNGIGMDMKYKERIFDVFQRLHTKEEFEGTGIGLAICKKIIERHQGKIWVESEMGEGTTFYFTIPKKIKNSANNLNKKL